MAAVSRCKKCGHESSMPFHTPVFSLLNCPGCGKQGTFEKMDDADRLLTTIKKGLGDD